MQDIANKYEYTGVSIRTTKDCVLIVRGRYNVSPVNNMAIAGDDTHQYSFFAHAESTINAGLTLAIVILANTTYYLWAGSVSTGNMEFDGYILGDGGTVTVT